MGRLFRFVKVNTRYGDDAVRSAESIETDTVIHPSPRPDWYATQEDHRSVWICKKASDEKIKVEPPACWGNAWAWNISEQGTGIVMRRVK
jgi:hypothetical protein